MATQNFSLPAVQYGVQIADPDTGAATAYYSDWMQRVLTQISVQINQILSTQAALAQAQQQLIAAQAAAQTAAVAAANAQSTADGAGPARSGNASANFPVGLGWSHGPQVNLAGVSAGNLTLVGTAPTQTGTTDVNAGDWTGQWRIQEIILGVETTVFTGTFDVAHIYDPDLGSLIISLFNNTDTSSVSIPRVTTGAISYRMDLQMTDPITVTDVLAQLFVRRS